MDNLTTIVILHHHEPDRIAAALRLPCHLLFLNNTDALTASYNRQTIGEHQHIKVIDLDAVIPDQSVQQLILPLITTEFVTILANNGYWLNGGLGFMLDQIDDSADAVALASGIGYNPVSKASCWITNPMGYLPETMIARTSAAMDPAIASNLTVVGGLVYYIIPGKLDCNIEELAKHIISDLPTPGSQS